MPGRAGAGLMPRSAPRPDPAGRHPDPASRHPDPRAAPIRGRGAVGASRSGWNSASSNTRASSVFSSAASWGGTGIPQRSMPSSMRRITVSMTSTRPLRLFSDETTSHGASGPFVSRSMSDTASSYCGPLLAVAPVLVGELPRLERVVAAADEPAQLLLVRHVHPELDHDHPLFGQGVLEVVDLLIGPAPLHLGRQVLDPLDQDPPVPAAVEDRHAAPSGQRRPEAPQEVVPQLVGRRVRRTGRRARGGGRAARPAA